ncbi:hypothetical protein U9M48_030344 [Paspalum notatum var. saurae]|uniref:Cytochrome P450 n=1 Tax=Paspalum notatum var. saurae TaxID=547442 RepID=A0AAQ3X362_PASNO
MGAVLGPKEIRMLPFGAGRRYCPGAELGMAHVGYFVAALLREFEWTLPVHIHAIDLSENSNFIAMMKTPLKARITPRAPTV